jgi:hypothetical protein
LTAHQRRPMRLLPDRLLTHHSCFVVSNRRTSL